MTQRSNFYIPAYNDKYLETLQLIFRELSDALNQSTFVILPTMNTILRGTATVHLTYNYTRDVQIVLAVLGR